MNQAKDNGCTALYVASQNNHVEVVCLLLSKSGIDINKVRDGGVTALYIASQEGRLEVVRLLLSKSGYCIIDINKTVPERPLYELF